MRKAISFVSATLLATVVGAAANAESRSLGKKTEGQVMLACINSGGQYIESGSSFGCKTDKGEVSCRKTGTLNQGAVGNCTGCNPSCGQSAKAGGKPSSRTVEGILTNGPVKKPQPLHPQQATASPGRVPTQPLTQQKVTRSPASASKQPLTQQKSTSSANANSKESMNASSSSRRNGR